MRGKRQLQAIRFREAIMGGFRGFKGERNEGSGSGKEKVVDTTFYLPLSTLKSLMNQRRQKHAHPE